MATFTKSKSKPQKVAPASEPSIVSSTVFSSSLGWILVAWQDDRLARISFGHESPAAAAKGANCEPVELEKAPKWVVKVIDKIKKFAAGKTVDWGNLPLAWEKRTEFQRRGLELWRARGRGGCARSSPRGGKRHADESLSARHSLPSSRGRGRQARWVFVPVGSRNETEIARRRRSAAEVGARNWGLEIGQWLLRLACCRLATVL